MRSESGPHFKASDLRPVALADIFATFFRIGLFTLGGGLAMTPVMHHELVIKRGWLRDDKFISEMSMATAVPGAIAVNLAYLLGRRLRGKAGSLAAISGTVLPSFVVILIIAGFLMPFLDHPGAAAFLRGCAIAIVGQLAFAGYLFGRKLLRGWRHWAVCAAGVAVVGVLGMHPLWGLVTASALGYWLCPGQKSQRAEYDADID